MSTPLVVGVIRGAQSLRGLVLRYEVDSNWRTQSHPFVYVIIPFDEGGHPVTPFRYDGPVLAGEQIEKQISDSQRALVQNAQLKLAGGPGQAPDSLHGFVPSNPAEPDGGHSNLGASLPDVSAPKLRMGANHALQEIWIDWARPGPPEAVVVLVPSWTSRPAEDREGAQRRAMLLTPLTLLGDVVVTPVAFGAYILAGGG